MTTIHDILYDHTYRVLQIRDRGQILIYHHKFPGPNNNVTACGEYITALVAMHPFMQISFSSEKATITAEVPKSIPISHMDDHWVPAIKTYNGVEPVPSNTKTRAKWRKQKSLVITRACNNFAILHPKSQNSPYFHFNSSLVTFDLCDPQSISMVEYFANNIITTMARFLTRGRSASLRFRNRVILSRTVQLEDNLIYCFDLIENAKKDFQTANLYRAKCV